MKSLRLHLKTKQAHSALYNLQGPWTYLGQQRQKISGRLQTFELSKLPWMKLYLHISDSTELFRFRCWAVDSSGCCQRNTGKYLVSSTAKKSFKIDKEQGEYPATASSLTSSTVVSTVRSIIVRTDDILQKSMTPLYQNDKAVYVTSHCNLGVSLR